MKVLVAPNSIKNAANASSIAVAIAEGLSLADDTLDIKMMPIADGGEYSLDILLNALGGERIAIQTLDPLNRAIMAEYGLTSEKEAIIELSKASGFELLSEHEKNPLLTSTYGTGLLIKDAIEKGSRHIYLTLGGSATVDGGSGILEALGIGLMDARNNILPRGGGNLLILDHFEETERIKNSSEIRFTLLCDVGIPLLGSRGAAMVYAPQKGAGPLETMVLERCLTHFGRLCESYSEKKLIHMKGAGAAGGVAVGMMAFFQAKIFPGTSFVLERLKAEDMISWADIVITAEGKLDSQTSDGKAPAVIAEMSKLAGKKVICIAGEVPLRGDQPDDLFDAVFSLQNKPMSLNESIEHTLENIRNTAFEIGRLITLKV